MNYIDLYIKFLKSFVGVRRSLKIIFDCSNGTSGLILKKIFPRAIFINGNPDGNFSAHGPDPMAKGAMNQLKKAVEKHGADLGIIFDADGDRVFFIDDKGRLIDSNEIAYMLMKVFKSPYVMGANLGWRVLQQNKNKSKQKVFISRIGHYFIKKMMREKKANFGAELSGHYYFSNLGGYWDSGILAAIHMINYISGMKERVSLHLDNLRPKYYRSGEINIAVSNIQQGEKILKKIENKYKKSANKISKIDGITFEFDDYWFNLRMSNTENLIRLNIEAIDKHILNKELEIIKRSIK